MLGKAVFCLEQTHSYCFCFSSLCLKLSLLPGFFRHKTKAANVWPLILTPLLFMHSLCNSLSLFSQYHPEVPLPWECGRRKCYTLATYYKMLTHQSCVPAFLATDSSPACTRKQFAPFSFMLDTTQETKLLAMNETQKEICLKKNNWF